MKVYLEKDCPNTNAILGALLSGGDPIKLAEIMVEAEKEDKGDNE